MREILFRGKSVNNGEWVHGNLVITTIEPADDTPIKHYHIEDMTIGVFPNEFQSGFDETVDPETVGQYTGLTDKNGKKIFEGDILRAKVYEYAKEDSVSWGKQRFRTGNKIDAFWTVEYKNFNASCGYFVYGKDRRFHRLLTHSVIFNNECEVIGNIHDNPALLEGE